jgi:hypothetical protein
MRRNDFINVTVEQLCSDTWEQMFNSHIFVILKCVCVCVCVRENWLNRSTEGNSPEDSHHATLTDTLNRYQGKYVPVL